MNQVDLFPVQEVELGELRDSEGAHGADQNALQYPVGCRRYAICFILGSTIVLTALDVSILSTAIPSITDEFHSLEDIAWYGSAYRMACAVMQLPCGKAYSLFSPRGCFLWSIIVFEVGSIISATAQSSNALIVGRTIAGFGDSGITTGALCIIAYSVPLRQRPAVNGAMGVLLAGAFAIGPLLGGVLSTKASWRWCFAINPIIGAPTFIAAATILKGLKIPERKPEPSLQKLMRLDWLGFTALLPGIICLLLAMQWGGTRYAWSSARIIVLLMLPVLFILAFIFIQRIKKEEAMLPLRIIRQRSIAAGAAYSFAIVAGGETISYYAPTWFQAIKGVNALQSGVMIIPLTAATGVTGIFAGILITYLGHYVPFMIFGGVSVTVGAVLSTQFQPDTSARLWVPTLLLIGAGIGSGFEQPQVAAQTVLSLEDIPLGMSVVVFAQFLGQSIFISVVGNILNNELVSGFRKKLPSIDTTTVLAEGATELQSTVPSQYILIAKQIYNSAITHTFYVCVVMAGLSLIASCFMEWNSVKDEVSDGEESEVPTNRDVVAVEEELSASQLRDKCVSGGQLRGGRSTN